MNTARITNFLCVVAITLLLVALVPLGGASADGNWEMLAKDGVSNPYYVQLIPIEVYEGKIYTAGMSFGAPVGGAIWSYDGKLLKKAAADGFGDANNFGCLPIAEFQGKLYTGTGNFAAGAQLWAYDGSAWEKVADEGFGDPNNWMAYPMGVIDGKLAIGCMTAPGVGCSLYTYDGATLTRLAGGGFGNTNNASTVAFSEPSADEMLITTENFTDGMEVFSFDGTKLTKVADKGINDPNNYDCKIISYNALEDAFYLGAMNQATGCEVWVYKDGKLTQFGDDGLGNVLNQKVFPDFRGGTVYFSAGYAGGGGPPPPGAVGRLYKKTGDNQVEELVGNGLGDPNNMELLSPKSFDGYQYVGTINQNGGQLWRAEVSPTLLDIKHMPVPAVAGKGAPAGALVSLEGFDFHEEKGDGKVLFDGVEARTTWWSDSSILAVVPPDAVTGEVTVVTSGGTSNPVEFEVTLPETWYFAEGSTRDNETDGSFDTYLCIENPNDKNIEVDVTFLTPGEDTEVVIPMGPNSRTTVNARDHLGSDVDFASIVSAEDPIAAERPMYFNYHGKWDGGHVVMGVTEPDETWYFAEGTTRDNTTDGSFEEWLTLMNPNSNDADVTITYMMEGGTTEQETVTVGGNDRGTVDVNGAVGSDRDVSLAVDSDIPIVAERPIYFDYHSMWKGGHDITGIAEPATEFYFAEGTTRDNAVDGSFQEWICLQNPGDEEASVGIEYMTSDAGTKTQDVTVGATSRVTVGVNQLLGPNVDCSAKVTSDQPIVAERPMYFSYHDMWDGGHDVAGCAYPKKNWYFAEGTTRDNDQDGTFHEYICIQNPGDADVNIAVTYLYGDTGYGAQELTIGPEQRHTIDVVAEVGVNKDISGVVITANSNIVCERPMYFNYHNKWQGGNDTMGYGL